MITVTPPLGGAGAIGSTTYAGYVPGYGPAPSVVTVSNTGGGGGGGVGYYTIGTTQPNYHTNIHISGPDPVLTTDKSNINLNELAEMIKIMRERLLILVPNFEKHEKYEALKKAYDHYKLIEAMVMEKDDGK